MTEIPHHVFDRGKEIISLEYLSTPSINICLYDSKQKATPIPHETDRWEQLHGRWYDPYYDDKATVNRLVKQLMQSDSGANRIVTDNI